MEVIKYEVEKSKVKQKSALRKRVRCYQRINNVLLNIADNLSVTTLDKGHRIKYNSSVDCRHYESVRGDGTACLLSVVSRNV